MSASAADRPTLRTIAERAGLGVTTVSRALKGGEEIAPRTRRRVRRIADELGYVPNRAGVGLRTGRTQVIALVLSPHAEVSEFALSMVMGLTGALEGSDYHVDVAPHFRDDDALGPIRRIVANRAADGLILSHTEPQDVRVRWLLERDFPFVTHGRTELATPHASHDFDNVAFAHEAALRLAAKGRRRLMLIGPPESLTYGTHMRVGFERASARSGADIVEAPGLTLATPPHELRAGIAALCRDANGPDGLVCGGDTAGLATIAGLHDAGVALGERADVVIKQTAPALDHLVPSVDTLYEDLEAAGRALGEQMLALLGGASPETLRSVALPEMRYRT